MSPDSPQDSDPVGDRDSDAARQTLDRHGHGFHYAVLKALKGISSGWRFEAAEFPVDLNGVPLHIDIVLRSPRALMAIECKRVNRALGAWCFARSPLVSTSEVRPQQVSLEQVFIPEGSLGHLRLMVVRSGDGVPTQYQYHVAQELKTDEKGDGQGGRSAINDAVTQAIRGANGLAEAFAAIQKPVEVMQNRSLWLLPVVVTSARLLVLTTDLAEADLATGHLPKTAKVETRPWLWFRTMTSSSLRHQVPASPSQGSIPYSLGALADRDYARSVGIVSVEGLADFLQIVKTHTGEHF